MTHRDTSFHDEYNENQERDDHGRWAGGGGGGGSGGVQAALGGAHAAAVESKIASLKSEGWKQTGMTTSTQKYGEKTVKYATSFTFSKGGQTLKLTPNKNVHGVTAYKISTSSKDAAPMLHFTDRSPITGHHKTRDGFLVADVKVARTGIQMYKGSEVGRPDLASVRVFRPEEEVFNVDSVSTYVNRTVTDNHPSEMVNAKNWKKHSVGTTGGKVLKDGEFISLPMMVLDEAMVKKVEAGKRELSCGYDAELVWEDGEFEGQHYDAVQRNIRINHLAIVDAGRAGSECRIRDEASEPKEGRRMTDQLRTVLLDGISIQTTDQGAQAIEKLQAQIKGLKDGQAVIVADLQKQIADKDALLGTKDGELKKLQDAAISPDKIDGMVAARSELVTKVKSLDAAFDCKGKTEKEIQRGIVAAKFGDAMVKDKSDDYVAALFDTLAANAGTTHRDPVRDALVRTTVNPSVQTTDAAVADAHAAMIANMNAAFAPQKGA